MEQQRQVPQVEPWDADDLAKNLRDPRNPYALLRAAADALAERAAINMREQDIPADLIRLVLANDGLDPHGKVVDDGEA